MKNSYLELPEVFYSRIKPEPVKKPELKVLNENLAFELGLDIDWLKSPEGVETLAGNRLFPGSESIALAYAGHQFGHFTLLGDGRAVLLGEIETPEGKFFDIQLKGSGRTPYSRGGDGRAALGPMLREYIISEALHNLGIPTTRSLAVVATGEEVIREKPLPGAVLTRVAKSHLRVGTFEFAAYLGNINDLKALADYTIKRLLPHAAQAENPYKELLRAVSARQAYLISLWKMVGFIHGVMNSDNMAISGETIDFGPCAFMDVYDHSKVFSSIDVNGRYRYVWQTSRAQENLGIFANTLSPLLHKNPVEAQNIIDGIKSETTTFFHDAELKAFAGKVGIPDPGFHDYGFAQNVLDLMYHNKADFTNTFVDLTLNRLDEEKIPLPWNWHNLMRHRQATNGISDETKYETMRKHNPAIIPRNHLVEEALAKAVEDDDYAPFNKLMELLKNPYAYSEEQLALDQTPPPSFADYKTFCGT